MRHIRTTELAPTLPQKTKKETTPDTPIRQSEPGSCSCGGTCPRCAGNLLGAPIGSPSDRHELEADRLAEHGIDKAPAGAASSDASATTAGDTAIGGPGRPLNDHERATYEGTLGADLSRVRVHEGAQAQTLAASVNAEAFTIGRNVVLGQNADERPATSDENLMTHELAHVVQQGGADALPGRQLPTQSAPTVMRRVLRNARVNQLCGGSEPFIRSPPSGNFHLAAGETQISVTANLRWDRPSSCSDGGEVFITLMRDIDFWFDSNEGEKTFPIGAGTPQVWPGLTGDENYYLEIRSNNTNPNCCLTGTIDITTP